MQDFATPFNPHATEPKVVQTSGGEVLVRPECCGSVCSPDCVVTPEVKDTDLVTLQIPVGFEQPDLTKDENWEPVFSDGVQIGRSPKAGEIYEPLTLTVAQLKDLVVSRIFVAAGNFADTRVVLAQIRKNIA